MKFVHMDNLTDEDRNSIWNDSKGEVNIIVLTEFLFLPDLEMLFRPRENDIFVFVDENVQWHKILVALGCFKSNSDAQRAGWRKDVEDGWTDMFKVSKPPRRRVIWTWKATSNIGREDMNPILKDDIDGISWRPDENSSN